jgi:tRNA pseudouridine55 synthase
MPDDIVLVDKPVGFSSFQIVRLFKKRHAKVGHAGTLDPCASGLLIILIGLATRRFTALQTLAKEYHGEMVLGLSTDSYDISGESIKRKNRGHPCRPIALLKEGQIAQAITALNDVAKNFVGDIQQTPPRFSALKVGGRRYYELSRKGQTVSPRSRAVHIESFSITDIQETIITFRVVVGKGVYIRALAHDFGDLLGCGATLVGLRRTRIGDYTISTAKKIGEIVSLCHENSR